MARRDRERERRDRTQASSSGPSPRIGGHCPHVKLPDHKATRFHGRGTVGKIDESIDLVSLKPY